VQFDYHERFAQIGKLALLGQGIEPGMVDYFARYAADHFFDEIDEIGVRDGANLEIPGFRGDTAQAIPPMLFAGFQLMFAMMAPALITGATADRWRFGSFVAFVPLWSVLVYAPIAHWLFSPVGWAASWGALDFAGGLVVHVNVGAAGLAAVPFCTGILRNGRRLGELLAAAALPEPGAGQLDLAAAPRRALVRTIHLGAVALAGLPILVVTQPFVPGGAGAAVLAIPLLALGVAAWRGAANLHGHVRAGAQVIVEALAHQARGPERPDDALAHLREVLPGLGEPTALRLEARSGAVGRTLAALDLRGRTGATVLALWREEGGVMVPGAQEALRAGDVLALAGTAEAVAAARALLAEPAAEPVEAQAS